MVRLSFLIFTARARGGCRAGRKKHKVGKHTVLCISSTSNVYKNKQNFRWSKEIVVCLFQMHNSSFYLHSSCMDSSKRLNSLFPDCEWRFFFFFLMYLKIPKVFSESSKLTESNISEVNHILHAHLIYGLTEEQTPLCLLLCSTEASHGRCTQCCGLNTEK